MTTGIEWNRQAIRVAQTTEARGSNRRHPWKHGLSYVRMGDYDNVLGVTPAGRRGFEQDGSYSAQVDWKVNIGNIELALGRDDSAEMPIEQALELTNKLGDDSAKSECYKNLALVSLGRGQVDSAQQFDEKLSASTRAPGRGGFDNNFRRIQAMRQNYSDAEKAFESVSDDTEAPTSLRWEAQSRLAAVYASEGKRAQADSQFRRAIDTIATARFTIRVRNCACHSCQTRSCSTTTISNF